MRGRRAEAMRLERNRREHQPNRPDFGKPLGGSLPACARSPSQARRSVSVRVLSPSFQVSPSFDENTLRSAQAAVAVALQDHARAARHLRHLVEREDQQLAVVADHRDVVAVGGHAEQRLLARLRR